MKKILSPLKGILKKSYLNLLRIYFKIAGSKVECNICHYKANRFSSDIWHLYCNCPYCGSSVRLRLLWASLTSLENFSFDKIINNKSVLHFAPEEAISKKLREKTKLYKTADFFAQGYSYHNIDYNLDISDMKTIHNNSFDCVIACDVLEHVHNHIEAIKEVHRILRNGGFCIFTVPQKDNLTITYEDASITDPEERKKAFGQSDHLRIYGNDFADILKEYGFDVVAVNESYFRKDDIEKFVLFPPILSNHPLATNYRKVFFGQKR